MPSFRRSRRRFRRRSGRRGLRGFARRIARAGTEPKHFENAAFLTDMVQGDGTTPQLRIRNIPSNLIQGDEEDQFHGNQVYLKGLGIRIAASTFDAVLPNFSTVKIRYTLLFSRTNATNMTGAGAVYDSATTDATDPVNASPFANPRLFDINATPGRFVGTGLETFFDRTNIKVIGSKMFSVNVGGAGASLVSKKLYFKINKNFQFQNPDASALTTAPNHGRFGSYYLITQIFTPPGVADPGSDTNFGTLSDTWHLYFRDP